MQKKQIRKIFREKRFTISATEKMKWDDLLLIQFQAANIPFIEHVLSFYPIEQNNEVNTFLITEYLHFKNPGLHISYPRTNLTDQTMEAVLCSADSIFEANAYNIPEPLDETTVPPEAIDLVVVPLLAFDLRGNRVGYGKGFYDRYLAGCRKDCIKIGFSYFGPVDSVDDAGEFDVPLDLCITPQRIYVF
ncbi:MAG TPA: 5-formyltetrahydrofolate cyclo-ligase [Flavisolibacter sp.]|nr:5-formyltetrahydrofolate cyclo-ligase [Flavisolibacter sp.]